MEVTWKLRDVLNRYVSEAISLESLQDELDRLAPQLASLGADSYPVRVADHVEITVAEFARGHRDEDELRQIVRLLLYADPTFDLSIGPVARGASGAKTLTPAY